MSFRVEDLPEDAINTKEIDSIYKYFLSIDWSERWVQGLVVFHLLTSLAIITTRRRLTFQAVVFCLLLASISLTERANEWLAENYKSFSKQQYFDSTGMFISLAYSAPVLINCVAILINWFLVSGDMLVSVKRRELEERGKEAKKEVEGKETKEEKEKGKETKKNQ